MNSRKVREIEYSFSFFPAAESIVWHNIRNCYRNQTIVQKVRVSKKYENDSCLYGSYVINLASLYVKLISFHLSDRLLSAKIAKLSYPYESGYFFPI